MKLIVMRHGEYDKNLPDKSLSSYGIPKLLKSIDVLKNVLYGQHYDVFSSPSKRCIQTAGYIEDTDKVKISESLDEKSSYVEIDSFIDNLLIKNVNSILITHRPQIEMILQRLDLCEIDLEPAGFIYIEILGEPKLLAVIQPSML